MATKSRKTSHQHSLLAWLAEVQAKTLSDEFHSGNDLADHLAQIHADSLRKLIGDDAVMARTARAEHALETTVGHLKAHIAIQRFLLDACGICFPRPVSKPGTVAVTTASARGERALDLESLSNSIALLAKRLRTQGADFPRATSLRYLAERHHAGNPVGFNRKRGGMVASQYDEPSAPRLEDLLESLAADIFEVAADLRASIGARRQIGGKLARYYRQIDWLASRAESLSPLVQVKPDAQLIADVLNVLLQPTEPLDASAIRKRLNTKS